MSSENQMEFPHPPGEKSSAETDTGDGVEREVSALLEFSSDSGIGSNHRENAVRVEVAANDLRAVVGPEIEDIGSKNQQDYTEEAMNTESPAELLISDKLEDRREDFFGIIYEQDEEIEGPLAERMKSNRGRLVEVIKDPSGLFENGDEQDFDLETPYELDVSSEVVKSAMESEYFSADMLESARECEDNAKLARRALEAEYKAENPLKHISYDSFSEGSGSSEGEYLFRGMDRDQREEFLYGLDPREREEWAAEIAEEELLEGDGEITSTWEHNTGGQLMAYVRYEDREDEYVTLVESWDELMNGIDGDYGMDLRDIVEGARKEIDDYKLAALKGIMEEEGEIDDRDLLDYAEERFAA